MPATDDELISRFVRQRDERAFRQLYARHSPAVYGLLRRLVGPRADVADDLLQDAWLRAAARLAVFRGESAFRTWLTGIAINCYRERRRSARDDRATNDDAADAATPSAERTAHVLHALDAMAPDHREVLVLHDIEGYTHEEIAALVGIEPGTSKSRLSRARSAFRRVWSGPAHTGEPR